MKMIFIYKGIFYNNSFDNLKTAVIKCNKWKISIECHAFKYKFSKSSITLKSMYVAIFL